MPKIQCATTFHFSYFQSVCFLSAVMSVFGFVMASEWLIYLTIALFILYIYVARKRSYWDTQNVKSHKSVPLIGTFAEVMFAPLHIVDQRAYKKLGKIWGTYEGNTPYLNVADLDMIKQITVKEFHNFVDRRVLALAGKSRITRFFLTNLKGEEWKAHRSVLTPTFTSGKLKQMTSLIEICAQEMTERFECAMQQNPNDVEVKDIFSKFVMNVIATCCFGYKLNTANANDPFFVNAKAMFSARTNIRVLFGYVMTYFENAVNEVVEMRKKSADKRQDFLQLLLDAQREDGKNKQAQKSSDLGEDHYNVNSAEMETPNILKRKQKVLSEEAVVGHSMLFLLVGYDTTAGTISFATYLLALNPDCQEKLSDEIQETFRNHEKLTYEIVHEMQYLDKVISETLRMFPAAVKTERSCNRDCKIGDIAIPKDMVIGIPIYCIHYDEEYYPEPKIFDPERFTAENKAKRNPYAYIPFGAGPRNCIGMRFALIEAKMALVHFFRKFRVSPSSDTQIPLKMRPGTGILQPSKGIHLKVEKR